MPPGGIDSLNADSLKGLVLSLMARIDELAGQNNALLARIDELLARIAELEARGGSRSAQHRCHASRRVSDRVRA